MTRKEKKKVADQKRLNRAAFIADIMQKIIKHFSEVGPGKEWATKQAVSGYDYLIDELAKKFPEDAHLYRQAGRQYKEKIIEVAAR